VGDDAGDGMVPASGGHGHAERVDNELGAHVVRHRVTQQPAAAEVEHRGQEQPALTGGDVGDVLHPGDIGRAGFEAPANQVGDLEAVRAGEGGLAPPAPAPTGHAVQPH
jgi:hypothetical protein